MYRLNLLGGPTLEDDGRPLAGRVVQRRRLALLALLASSCGGPISRDKLIAFLWPGSDRAPARHLLSDSLHVIRKALSDGAVLAEGDELRLNLAVVSSDVVEFEAALKAGNLERAVGIYSGPFLDGFFVGGDALEFERWAARERERLADAYLEVLERLAESAVDAGEPRRAADWWRRVCAEAPDSPRAVLGLMTAQARAGDRAGALRHAAEHAEHLQREYGIEPDPRVTALIRRLRRVPDAWVTSAGISDHASGAAAAKVAERSDATVARAPNDPRAAEARGFRSDFALRRVFLGCVVAAAMVFLATFTVIRWQNGPALIPHEARAANVLSGIAVLPFTVNDHALDTWREGMVGLLTVNLDEVLDLRTIDSRTIIARWTEAVPDTAQPDLATSLGVARRAGARYALLGSVVVIGADIRLTANVYDVKDGTKRGQGQVAGAADSVLALVDRLTVEVSRAMPRYPAERPFEGSSGLTSSKR